jgi:RNA polymerase sigma-70 factor (ECF subfamily)
VTGERGHALPGAQVPGRTSQPGVGHCGKRQVSDAELLERICLRDEHALAELYDRHAGLVLSVALRVVGDRELAEEVLQDTFLRCWQHAHAFQAGRGGVLGWLMGITRNRAIDLLRSRQHKARQREQAALPDADTLGMQAAPDEAEAVVIRQVVTTALAALPRTQRQVIELAYYGGLTQNEIAQATGEPLGTVKSRTRIALDQLRASLRPWFSQPSGYDSEGHGRQ